MIEDIDKDMNGSLELEDFLTLMTAKMGERDSGEEIAKAFRLFDDDETGKISFKNLKRVAKCVSTAVIQMLMPCQLPTIPAWLPFDELTHTNSSNTRLSPC